MCFFNFFTFQFLAENSLITICEESTKTGPYVYLDFQRITRLCSCNVRTFFTGDLLVHAVFGTTLQSCSERVIVSSDDYKAIFGCDASYPLSTILSVQANYTTVHVTSDYSASVTSDMFYPCFLFRQNGGLGMKIYYFDDFNCSFLMKLFIRKI